MSTDDKGYNVIQTLNGHPQAMRGIKRPRYWQTLTFATREAIDARTAQFARQALNMWNGSEIALNAITSSVMAYHIEQCQIERRRRKQQRVWFKRIPCGARRKNGVQCKAMAEPHKNRCRFHGGRSTGSKTIEGRLKSLAGLPQYKARPELLIVKRRELEAAL